GRRIGISDHTRVSHAVYERSTGLEYRFVPEGPVIEEEACRRCLAAIEALDFAYLVASGSLPRGVKPGFYVEVGAIVRRKGAKLVLDTSGPALRETLAAGGVHLVKPSLGEFEQFSGRSLRDPAAQEEAALDLVHRGGAELVAVTMGHEGALLASADGVIRHPALPVTARSAVGAGDSFVAGMTFGLARGQPAARAFRLGIAAGTAAVLTPGTELCRREDVERLLPMVG
ncbi:MAG TPA: PfkB family carbohydrate kinase, partial [Beijerinckiaceae bacterium]|nr:PfkB family carbohydrate kinase [Beijerinckiaceae bacterium]